MNKHIPPSFSPPNKYRKWARDVAVAAVVTLVIYAASLYISYGTIFRPFKYTVGIELTLTFFYFLLLFWVYPKISRFIHSRAFLQLNKLLTNVMEGFIVVLATAILTAAVKILPIWITVLLIEDAQIVPDAVRRNFVIHAVSGLFFYYFVERNRIRKRLQQERLNAARLEKEKFHAELQELKNQVNPHFLFNSLEILTPLIKKDQEESVEFVRKLSEVYRSILAQSDNELATLSEEVEIVEAYFYLLKRNFKDSVEIQLNSLKEVCNFLLPAGILFFLIENLVKRKERTTEEKLTIQITAGHQKLKMNCNRDLGEDLINKMEKQIRDRYTFFSVKLPEVFSKNNNIIVELPLLKIENNESSNY